MRARAPITLITAAVLTALLSAGVGHVSAQEPAAEPPDGRITSGAEQRDLDRAKARWRNRGPASYRFRVTRSCFCGEQYTRPTLITVRRGRPVRPPQEYRDVATVPRLFRTVQEAIDARVVALTVRYESRYGFPRTISIDRARMIADDEVTYTADRFRRLQASP